MYSSERVSLCIHTMSALRSVYYTQLYVCVWVCELVSVPVCAHLGWASFLEGCMPMCLCVPRFSSVWACVRGLSPRASLFWACALGWCVSV